MTRAATLLTVLGIILLLVCLHARSARAEPAPCWRIKLELIAVGINPRDRVAARKAARERGWSEIDIRDAERRCAK